MGSWRAIARAIPTAKVVPTERKAKAIVQIARATTRDDLEVIRSRVDARLLDGSINNDEAEAVLREVDQKESELIESEVL
jgi:coenzyme F420-reducing hydrogenase gamma subunit